MKQPKHIDSEQELLSFLRDYCTFEEGRLYLLIGMARPRENEHIAHGEIPMFREILTDEETLDRRYSKLKTMTDNYIPEEGKELTFRFYLSTNARDLDKSFYLFKQQLQEYTYHLQQGHTETQEKIKRLDKEWKSTLQTEGNKEESRFIIDIDTDEYDFYETTYQQLEEETTIIESIKSPNGFHIITEPFGYPQCEFITENEDIEIKTDGLMFLMME